MDTRLPHDEVVPFGASALTKKQQVETMFDRIAFRYDFLNRFLSGGIDIYWRKQAIIELKQVNPQLILDMATGTGDMAIMMNKQIQPEKIVGIDLSNGMLNIGREKIAKLGLAEKISMKQGDSEHIDFETGTFDAVSVAFGVRNYENLQKGLAEMLRVLKPGGKLVILEFSKPGKPMKWFYDLYMERICPMFGQFFSKNGDAYRYLNNSVKAFPQGSAFTGIMQETGYEKVYSRRMTFGICSIYCGYKKP
ncbi:MAG: bifunctional demethylmenaquinone methyltransferase/2-methoxy-6-polyprenyl-1,4-benzoquinol methylase UbiE [Chitinophagaceae bacterium]